MADTDTTAPAAPKESVTKTNTEKDSDTAAPGESTAPVTSSDTTTPASSPDKETTPTSPDKITSPSPEKNAPSVSSDKETTTATSDKTATTPSSAKATPTSSPEKKTTSSSTGKKTTPKTTSTSSDKKTTPTSTGKKATPKTTPTSSDKKTTPSFSDKKTTPASSDKKTTPASSDKKSTPASPDKKTTPTSTGKKATPKTTPTSSDKKATPTPSDKKTTPTSSKKTTTTLSDKKTTSTSSKKTTPTDKKTTPTDKKTTPTPSEKKKATPTSSDKVSDKDSDTDSDKKSKDDSSHKSSSSDSSDKSSSDHSSDEDTCHGDTSGKTSQHIQVTVDVGSSVFSLSKKFLSMAVGARMSQRMNAKQFDTNSQKIQNLAAALAPCELRVGGTYMQSLLFTPDGTKDNLVHHSGLAEFFDKFAAEFWDLFGKEKEHKHYLLNTDQWDTLNTFLQKVGWDLHWDFNNILYKDGLWDPTNATLLLNYSAQKGYKIAAFQLGNEPNSQGWKFNVGVTPDILAQDYKTLKDLLATYPLYQNSNIVGPEVTQKGIPDYYVQFLDAGGKDHVTHASFHHYSASCKVATPKGCLNLPMLDGFKDVVEKTTSLTAEKYPGLPVALTETGTFHGGGAKGVSNRFCSGFLWLDKLGLCAKHGVCQVFRSTFWGADYGVLHLKSLSPNADYYLSLLHKRLIEGPVFDVSFTPRNPKIRLYANNARKDSCYVYPEGSLVVYYLNVSTKRVTMTFTQFASKKLDLFILTSGDAGLDSWDVKLNGKTLEMPGDELPTLSPQSHTGDVIVPGQSFGFIVIPEAYQENTSDGSVSRSIKS